MKKLKILFFTISSALVLLACERRENPVPITEAIEENTGYSRQSDGAQAEAEKGSDTAKAEETSKDKQAAGNGGENTDTAKAGQEKKKAGDGNVVALSKKGVNPGTVKLSDAVASVEKEDKSTVYTDGNGDIVLDADLFYPIVTVEGNESVSNAINAAFDSVREDDDKWIYQCTKDPTYEIPKDAYWIYRISRDYEIKRMENGILSIMLTGSRSWRDEAPTLTATVYNFDLKTGKILTLSDFFSDPASLQDAAAKIISQQIETGKDRPKFNDNYEDAVCIWDDRQWYLTRDSLVVVFGPYMIAASDYGIPEFKVPLADLKDFWIRK